MKVLEFFKKQNLIIKIGFVALIISLVTFVLALILIGTANFKSTDSNNTNPNLIGNGFTIINNYGIHQFLTSQGYSDFQRICSINYISNAPVAQLTAGIVFLVIILPISGIVSVVSLTAGYFKKWLYS